MAESIKVLIVDDSNIVCERLAKMLAGLNKVSVVALTGSAAEARRLIAGLQPDVITLDLQLSDGSGLGVLREVKSVRPAPTVIVLTNHTGPVFREVCQRRGADHYFDKATEFEKVCEVLQELADAIA